MFQYLVAMGLVAILAGCASDAPAPDKPVVAATGISLFAPATVLQDDWQHLPLVGETDYQIAEMAGRLAIRAEAHKSASMLSRRVRIDLTRCPVITWSWAVSRLQGSADLKTKASEDVAAAIYVLFDDPGFLSDPKPVPTLRYVWTNAQATKGSVIDSPYLPGTVRSLVLRTQALPGQWVSETRNLVEDFKLAFGTTKANPTHIHAIALFTDNDQTGEPVEAYYGRARAVCE